MSKSHPTRYDEIPEWVELEDETQQLYQDIDNGNLTVHEIRARMGLPPLKGPPEETE